MNYTTNLHLNKPEYEDYVDVSKLNENMDTLDGKIGAIGNSSIMDLLNGKADKEDTELTTTLSRGRKASTTVGTGSFAFGSNVTASGAYSHCEGASSTASGPLSHAEGLASSAEAENAHAEGNQTTASGVSAHAEGTGSRATYDSAHAEGQNTVAKGANAHTEGKSTIASRRSQHVFGEYNREDTQSVPQDMLGYPGSALGKYVEIVGNGTGEGVSRSNARTLDWDGNERLKGDLYINCNADSTGGSSVSSMLASKADLNYGAANAGKFLRVGSDGTIEPIAIANASGVNF